AAARELGEAMAEREIRLVYGGARIGMMGEVADAVMKNGGRVTGVIPEHLQTSEVGHRGLAELHIVDSMHSRKAMMFDRSDAFAILPGGLGTLDEAFEMLTWRQLRLHDKPIILIDIDGYWDPFQTLVDHMIGKGFARESTRQHFSVVSSIGRVFDLLDEPAAVKVTEHPERI
ncbi:MAG: TIGR00730 family Rossman fold protein, partial [Dongia sp.]